MKKFTRPISVIALLALMLLLTSCSIIPPSLCKNHWGGMRCNICMLDYMEEVRQMIKDNATSSEDGEYELRTESDNVDFSFTYKTDEYGITCSIVYKEVKPSLVVFLLKIYPTHKCTWALGDGNKVAVGDFDAEELDGFVFRPNISDNSYTDEEWASLNHIYEESVSFCVDMLYSFIAGNDKNLKISNFGFKNYTPNVELE